jgi:GDP-D-mannose dehydratase
MIDCCATKVKDHVAMQWLMLSRDTPDDFVIATGHRHRPSPASATLRFEGVGIDEVGISDDRG